MSIHTKKFVAVAKSAKRILKVTLSSSYPGIIGSNKRGTMAALHEEDRDNLYSFLSHQGFHHSEITIK